MDKDQAERLELIRAHTLNGLQVKPFSVDLDDKLFLIGVIEELMQDAALVEDYCRKSN